MVGHGPGTGRRRSMRARAMAKRRRRAGDIVVVGSLNVDRVTVASALPGPGQTVAGSSFDTHLGGKGANEAAAAALLRGTGVCMVGVVGDGERAVRPPPAADARARADEAARMLIQGLTERGVDCAHVTKARGAQTGSATIIVSEANGDNVVIVVPGANHAWSAAKRKSVETVVRDAKVVCLQV